MSKRKSNKTKLAEGRCQGIGRDYVPFHKVQESRSIGTASMIPDPIEHRCVHVLSKTEYDLYWLLRWSDLTAHIREQFLLDTGYLNEHVMPALGLSCVSPDACYTTDFLVNRTDGTLAAYSVKFKEREFDPNALMYKGHENRYAAMVNRQRIEQRYWGLKGVPFKIVTSEHIPRTLVSNIAMLFGWYDDRKCVTNEQKLMYLLAHKYYRVDMTSGYINPKALLGSVPFDIASEFERMRLIYGEVDYGT